MVRFVEEAAFEFKRKAPWLFKVTTACLALACIHILYCYLIGSYPEGISTDWQEIRLQSVGLLLVFLHKILCYIAASILLALIPLIVITSITGSQAFTARTVALASGLLLLSYILLFVRACYQMSRIGLTVEQYLTQALIVAKNQIIEITFLCPFLTAQGLDVSERSLYLVPFTQDFLALIIGSFYLAFLTFFVLITCRVELAYPRAATVVSMSLLLICLASQIQSDTLRFDFALNFLEQGSVWLPSSAIFLGLGNCLLLTVLVGFLAPVTERTLMSSKR